MRDTVSVRFDDVIAPLLGLVLLGLLGFVGLFRIPELGFGGMLGFVTFGQMALLAAFTVAGGLVLGGVAWFAPARLVLRHVRTFCHSQLISSSVGVRSSAMPSPSGPAFLAADWPDC